MSTGKEPTVTGAVIEGDFPRGQRLGRLGQSTAKPYTANVQGNIHHTVPRKFHLMLLDGQFLTLPHTVQKERICLFRYLEYDVPYVDLSACNTVIRVVIKEMIE